MPAYFSPFSNLKKLCCYNYLMQLIALQKWHFSAISKFGIKGTKQKRAVFFASVLAVQQGKT